MPSESPLWLPIEEVIAIAKEVVGETGEPFHILKPDLLESAVVNPINKYEYSGERDIVALAAALLLAIARNHPLLQGNKRTAFIAAENFLQINGYILLAPDTEDNADFIMECIETEGAEQDLIDYLRSYIVTAPDEA